MWKIYILSLFFWTQMVTSFCNLLFPFKWFSMVLSQYVVFLTAFDLSKMISEQYYHGIIVLIFIYFLMNDIKHHFMY